MPPKLERWQGKAAMGGGGATAKTNTTRAKKERPGSACFAPAAVRKGTRDKIAIAALLHGLKGKDGRAGYRPAAGAKILFCLFSFSRVSLFLNVEGGKLCSLKIRSIGGGDI